MNNSYMWNTCKELKNQRRISILSALQNYYFRSYKFNTEKIFEHWFIFEKLSFWKNLSIIFQMSKFPALATLIYCVNNLC